MLNTADTPTWYLQQGSKTPHWGGKRGHAMYNPVWQRPRVWHVIYLKWEGRFRGDNTWSLHHFLLAHLLLHLMIGRVPPLYGGRHVTHVGVVAIDPHRRVTSTVRGVYRTAVSVRWSKYIHGRVVLSLQLMAANVPNVLTNESSMTERTNEWTDWTPSVPAPAPLSCAARTVHCTTAGQYATNAVLNKPAACVCVCVCVCVCEPWCGAVGAQSPTQWTLTQAARDRTAD